jgi:hypothetical protein
VEAGQILARGFGLTRTESVARPLVMTVAGLETVWRLPSPWIVELTVEGLVPWWRDRFAVTGPDGEPDVLHRPTPVGFAAELGVGVTFN